MNTIMETCAQDNRHTKEHGPQSAWRFYLWLVFVLLGIWGTMAVGIVVLWVIFD